MGTIDFSEMIEIPCETESGFIVTDIKTADWCIAKIGEAEKRMQERADLVSGYMRKLVDWLEKNNAPDRQTVEYMRETVRPWAEIEIMKGKAKSIKLPCGTVGVRAGRDSIQIDDEEAAILWAKAFKPEAVKVEEHILKSQLAGTDCPHYHTETSPASFYVKPDESLFKLEDK